MRPFNDGDIRSLLSSLSDITTTTHQPEQTNLSQTYLSPQALFKAVVLVKL